MFRSILVALDGSRMSARVLDEAVAIAQAEGARLTLISVAAQPRWRFTSPYLVPYPTDDDLERQACRVVEQAEERVPDGVPVATVVRRGPMVAKAILDRVVCGEHDLVVMGSHGRGAIAAFVLGSVSRAVAAKSPVPVHVVGAGSSDQREGPSLARVAAA